MTGDAQTPRTVSGVEVAWGSCRLPQLFDADALSRDLARVQPGEWIPHFNTADYQGEWSIAHLRAVQGDPRFPYPSALPDLHADTPLLLRCGYFREVLAAFRCPLCSVRLMKLEPGAEIREHADSGLSLFHGQARLHVPIQTNEGVNFRLGGARLRMAPGECWYHDFTLPHRVVNRGTAPRVHLVLDCHVDPWLEGRILGGDAEELGRTTSLR
jgi:hypothetical protein